MRGDPYQTTASYKSVCAGCGKAIKRGDTIYIWPLHARGNKVYCSCAESDFRECMSAIVDEDAGYPVSSYM